MDQPSILSEEIKSWLLREEDRLLFSKMPSECRENGRPASSKDEYFSAESLFMILILQQQKMINGLMVKVSKLKRSSGKLT